MQHTNERNTDWQSERLAAARLQLLSVAQWLARVGRSYVPGSSHKSDVLLDWQQSEMVATQQFASNLRVELDIKTLTMWFTENGSPSEHKIEVEDHSPAHVEAWLLIELLHRGIDRSQFSRDLPYDTTGLMSGDAEEFSPEEYRDELGTLATLFSDAAHVLDEVVQQAGDRATPLYVCPQSLCLESCVGALRIGFSLGDATAPTPYFYTARIDRTQTIPEGVLKISDMSTDLDMTPAQSFFEGQLREVMH